MIFISFLISYIGFFAVKSVEPRILQPIFANFHQSVGMKIIFSLIVSVCSGFFSVSPIGLWSVFIIFIGIATQFEKILRWSRKSKLKIETLSLLDDLILKLRAGGNLKQSIDVHQREDGSWFQGFSMELKKCLEFENIPNTESVWFNKFISEIVEIHNSRVKTLDQLLALRRSIRSEIQFEKKMDQVLSGPRFQMIFMSSLFVILNIYFIFNHDLGRSRELLIPAWTLFLMGIIVTRFFTQRIKWKI